MKRKTHLIAALFLSAAFVTSCKDDVKDLKTRVDHIETRVSTLEQQVKLLTTNVSSIQGLIQAVEKRDHITSVEEINESGTTGYKITTALGHIWKLLNGINGTTPNVGVKKDADGIYYWTINGEFMRDSNGAKIRAQSAGDAAIVPKFKIESKQWYVSTDNGVTWQEIAGARVGADITIEDKGDYVGIKLADGTVLSLPKKAMLSIAFDLQEYVLHNGYTYRIPYEITGADAKTLINVISSAGVVASVTRETSAKGVIHLKVNNLTTEQEEVVVLLSDGRGQTFMQSLVLAHGALTLANSTNIAPPDGGNFSVPVSTNLTTYTVQIPASATWLTYVNNTARASMRNENINFTATANDTGAPRTATVTVRDGFGAEPYTITITQATQGTPMPSITRADVLGTYTASYKLSHTGATRTSTITIEAGTGADDLVFKGFPVEVKAKWDAALHTIAIAPVAGHTAKPSDWAANEFLIVGAWGAGTPDGGDSLNWSLTFTGIWDNNEANPQFTFSPPSERPGMIGLAFFRLRQNTDNSVAFVSWYNGTDGSKDAVYANLIIRKN